MVHAVTSLIFWLLVIPFCIGLIPANFIVPGRRSLGLVFLGGCFGMWALFALTAIPAVLWVEYENFKTASAAFSALAILSAAGGILLWRRNRARGGESLLGLRKDGDTNVEEEQCLDGSFERERNPDGSVKKERNSDTDIRKRDFYDIHVKKGDPDDVNVGDWKGWVPRLRSVLRGRSLTACVFWLLFFVLLGFQLYKAAAFASFDGDDAYYVVESLLAQEAGVMYRILPYTGGSTGLDVRHVLAVFPMWVAFVAVRAGLHATIVSHVAMPLFLIPLTYLLYYEIGSCLFAGDTGERRFRQRENLPAFLALLSLFQIFGNVSIYTNETFFLTRTWQGKAVAGSLVIPAFLWLFLLMRRGKGEGEREGKSPGLWLLFVCLNLTAGICSSIAVFLVSFLTAVTAAALAVAQRDWKLLFKYGAACVPNLVYMGIYAFIGYSYLL